MRDSPRGKWNTTVRKTSFMAWWQTSNLLFALWRLANRTSLSTWHSSTLASPTTSSLSPPSLPPPSSSPNLTRTSQSWPNPATQPCGGVPQMKPCIGHCGTTSTIKRAVKISGIHASSCSFIDTAHKNHYSISQISHPSKESELWRDWK